MVANPTYRQISTETTSPLGEFVGRHIGPKAGDIHQMLNSLGVSSLEELIEQTVPSSIRFSQELNLPAAQTEHTALAKLKQIANKNQIYRSYIGMGYYDCITPPVIQRNILENPGWYTAYTPYQPEISQGRLEALLNFQTMIIDLTGLEIANASLLDEATAAAEAMSMSYGVCKNKSSNYFVSSTCHPQTIDVLQTRAKPLGITIIIGDHQTFDFAEPIFGAILQYPGTDGKVHDYRQFIAQSHAQGALVTIAADPLSLTLLTPPGELGADIAIGSTQRFGIPLGFGGPHAAYFATKEEYKRLVPGRIVGVSKDVHGKLAYRLALQTREQHIRRDKATSNICTAQVLLAVMASMYAVYHGPNGLKKIAENIHQLTKDLAAGLEKLGYEVLNRNFFDTLRVGLGNRSLETLLIAADERNINLRIFDDGDIGISLDETTSFTDVIDLWQIFAFANGIGDGYGFPFKVEEIRETNSYLGQIRTSPYLTHPIFNSRHSETELLRYLHQLETKDLSLTTSMIALGSCTMKLNATSEMIPVSWAEFSKIHPFAPITQTRGYQILFQQLATWLAEITGFASISLQPNAGSQGEYAGLLVIREYHQSRQEGHRNICLIPQSAHGTNPASAVMCGMKVVAVACDECGNIDLGDLSTKVQKHSRELAALMITYPSTHGVFEETIQEICDLVHQHGGQVYMDGANMNAQVGICRPGDLGADVCHLNLHKTFCIPHGGGGPGMGPIGVAPHLVEFLPGHSVVKLDSDHGAVSAAPWGSASILVISWMYIAMMGADGLTQATKIAILNANYIAKRLESFYPVLYKGKHGFVAHECILDLRGVKKSANIEVDDIAKRLMDYGFHAPTVSWPVAGTIMVEPTESESKAELDRFCDALIAIRQEILHLESGIMNPEDNPLKNAPHTIQSLIVGDWNHCYSREQAAYPTDWTRQFKFWPSVGRIDAAFGDRNFVCSCLPLDSYM
ncbi:aminomethyl-transferring glycine dehydrogenase [Cylindrospermopsis raciborskii]|uniref:Glycine dehydrogenase (decarboxylating) n=1 Tax=Cylindrospermopsis raciborskii CS-505 TaxID=533240 RepID=A0A853M990_9CYAN|nr:aminomethyl-transferring glycine dehydrogenase [Cylindrospermopsis raciborskii]EFA68070.1 Aromatic amino acid beta-eliminating lyase/threonine aldolase [Cylindrospermopsis raciborskii CS-505]OBU75980.1 glycine dehydrogenase (aminomethyl-transferring) [Cylindrospermopsis raciborskii CS-505]